MHRKTPLDKDYRTMATVLDGLSSVDSGKLFGTDEFLYSLKRRGDDIRRGVGGPLIIGEGRRQLDFIGNEDGLRDGSVIYTRWIPIAPTGWRFGERFCPDEYPRDFAHVILSRLGFDGAGEIKNYKELGGGISGPDREWDFFEKKPSPLPYIKEGKYYPLRAVYEHPVVFSIVEEKRVMLPGSLLSPSTLGRLHREGYSVKDLTAEGGSRPKKKTVWAKSEEIAVKGVGRDVLLVYLDEDSLNLAGRPTDLVKKFGDVPKKYRAFII